MCNVYGVPEKQYLPLMANAFFLLGMFHKEREFLERKNVTIWLVSIYNFK